MSEKKHRILIVDDEPDLTDIVDYRFRAANYETFTAPSGKEALEVLNQEPIDVILSDIRMKDLSGIELLKEVRKAHGEQIFLLITGFADVTLTDIFDLGVEAIFSKPANYDTLIAVTNQALSFKNSNKPGGRIYPRYKATIEVDWKLADNDLVLDAKTFNVGQGGMFIALDNHFPKINDLVDFSFSNLSGGFGLVRIRAICKWVRQIGDSEIPAGIGVQFLKEDISEYEKLLRVINAIKTKEI